MRAARQGDAGVRDVVGREDQDPGNERPRLILRLQRGERGHRNVTPWWTEISGPPALLLAPDEDALVPFAGQAAQVHVANFRRPGPDVALRGCIARPDLDDLPDLDRTRYTWPTFVDQAPMSPFVA